MRFTKTKMPDIYLKCFEEKKRYNSKCAEYKYILGIINYSPAQDLN